MDEVLVTGVQLPLFKASGATRP